MYITEFQVYVQEADYSLCVFMGMSDLMLAPRSFHICTGVDCKLSLTCLYDYCIATVSMSYFIVNMEIFIMFYYS